MHNLQILIKQSILSGIQKEKEKQSKLLDIDGVPSKEESER